MSINPMETAPKDGSRVLVRSEILHYSPRSHQYELSGHAWIEAWFDTDNQKWQEWCGDYSVTSTFPIIPTAWSDLPK